MWIVKFRVFDEDNTYSTKTRKYKVNMHYYPVNYYIEKRIYYFIAIGILEGSESNKRKFFEALEKGKKISKVKRFVVNLEVQKDFFICITAQVRSVEFERFVHLYYNPKFIHIKPAIIKSDGWEEWEIATLNKKDIENLLKISVKRYKGKLLVLRKAKLSGIGILTILPKLTNRQNQALELAIENGYYEYPRQIELEKLAKLMKLSLSTYQAHLRKAEKKLLPFVYSRLK